MAQGPDDHPYGSGYNKAIMDEAFYADTWQHTSHPHIGNETAYVGDVPSDYYHPSVEAHALYQQRPSRLS